MPIERYKMSEEDKNVIFNMQDSIDEIDKEIELAKEVDIDVTEVINLMNKVKKQRKGLLKNYT